MWCREGAVYVHGGESPEGDKCSDLHKFDGCVWRSLRTKGQVPVERSGHVGFSVGHAAYIWGGGEAGDNVLYKLELCKLKWSCLRSQGRRPSTRKHCMWWVDSTSQCSTLWVRGGQDTDVLGSQSISEICQFAKTTTVVDSQGAVENGVWCCDLQSGEWQYIQEEKGFVPPPMNEVGCALSSDGTRWAFGGYWDAWDYPTVAKQSNGAPDAIMLSSFYYNSLYMQVAGSWKLVVAADQAPERSAGAVVAALPGGDGVVIFAGYNTLNSEQNNFVKKPRCFGKTFVCRTSTGRFCLPEPRQGPQIEEQLRRRQSPLSDGSCNGLEEHVESVAAGMFKFDPEPWLEACRQVVKGDLQLRRSFSVAAHDAFQNKGPGALAAFYPTSGMKLVTEMMQPHRFQYWTPKHVPDGVSCFVHGQFCRSFSSMPAFDFHMGFMMVLLPSFDGLSHTEQTEDMWGAFMQGFCFGYAGAGALRHVDPHLVQHSDKEGFGSTTNLTAVHAAISAHDPTDHMIQVATIEKCAKPGCLSISSKGAANLLQTMSMKATWENPQAPPDPRLVVLSKCSRCKRVAYCGRECQLADWKRHKLECAELAVGKAASSSLI